MLWSCTQEEEPTTHSHLASIPACPKPVHSLHICFLSKGLILSSSSPWHQLQATAWYEVHHLALSLGHRHHSALCQHLFLWLHLLVATISAQTRLFFHMTDVPITSDPRRCTFASNSFYHPFITSWNSLLKLPSALPFLTNHSRSDLENR